MRRFFICLFLTLLLGCVCSCDRTRELLSFHQNYIQGYRTGELSLYTAFLRPEEEPEITRFYMGAEEYISPQTDPVEFERLASRNGDVSYNQWINEDPVFYKQPVAFAYDFGSLHITSNADWDTEHPAGSLLDDIMQVEMSSYAEYIRNGYTGPVEVCHKKLASELSAEDMAIVSDSYFTIRFMRAPTLEREHTLTVTLTTTDGKVYTDSLYCIPEVESEN